MENIKKIGVRGQGSGDSKGILFLLFFLTPHPSPLTPSLWAGELRTSLGAASYQYEGAGPGGDVWEEKPTYNSQPFFSAQYCPGGCMPQIVGLVPSKFEMNFLAGRHAGSPTLSQPIERKVETWQAAAGWTWLLPQGLGFEIGPMALNQRHRLRDLAGGGQTSRDITRLGSYFGILGFKNMGLWQGRFSARVGVLGWPRRQSAASFFSLGLDRPLGHGPWRVGLEGATGLFQLERDGNETGNVGQARDVVILFRQGETDYKAALLTVSRSLGK
ncbi:MAG: hypothetical protein HY401_04805 [Elusimicrobia bacterium]|nr:hypothetical protein [Elusimicrobiota bacterium]